MKTKTASFPLSGERQSARIVHVPSGEKEKVQRCSGPEDWEVGRGPISSVGTRASGSRSVVGGGRGTRGRRRHSAPPAPGRAPSRSAARALAAAAVRRSRAWGPGRCGPAAPAAGAATATLEHFAEDPRLQHLGHSI